MNSSYDPSANSLVLASIGRKLMNISEDMINKNNNDDSAIRLANRMSSFGDAMTCYGAPWGPKSLDALLKLTGATKKEAELYMKIGQSNKFTNK